MISKRDNRGLILKAERLCVLGFICRSTKFLRLKLGINRNEASCLDFVKSNINIDSTIYIDMWKGYGNLNLNS